MLQLTFARGGGSQSALICLCSFAFVQQLFAAASSRDAFARHRLCLGRAQLDRTSPGLSSQRLRSSRLLSRNIATASPIGAAVISHFCYQLVLQIGISRCPTLPLWLHAHRPHPCQVYRGLQFADMVSQPRNLKPYYRWTLRIWTHSYALLLVRSISAIWVSAYIDWCLHMAIWIWPSSQ
ncbi:uncharacterized protein M421DRAFT_117764 [Didymella exigua CBS 183.55]|uniref:Secreted protein n=1 Tax=Didymella exigua CBS 183.55 TaxID=1150837 RepID=A0A6A5S4L6_9PLEO|nr:uncharacterized protein M421DRAFT_117764 [Didymella exigua CBS 183.55]KAF1934288.1 hypothetical protein M421DRAFT_117764 [Didymella exigua CBS 183.55]